MNNIRNLLIKNSVPFFDGLGMLVEQAATQFYLWHNQKPQTNYVLAKLVADT
jgi:shikimate 5-dehydrogenase